MSDCNEYEEICLYSINKLHSYSTLFVGYRSYSDDGKILEDTTDNFNFEKRDSEYLREILEDSKLIEDEVESNIKPPRH
jgi:hypothetical protein